MIFMQMLKACKYTKFREVNFKVLARILVTPKVLATIKKNPALANCPWCDGVGTLEHTLVTCSHVHKVRKMIWKYNKYLFSSWTRSSWIFGSSHCEPTTVAWVVNFMIYKAMLRAVDKYRDDLWLLVQSECAQYSTFFPVLQTLLWTEH